MENGLFTKEFPQTTDFYPYPLPNKLVWDESNDGRLSVAIKYVWVCVQSIRDKSFEQYTFCLSSFGRRFHHHNGHLLSDKLIEQAFAC